MRICGARIQNPQLLLLLLPRLRKCRLIFTVHNLTERMTDVLYNFSLEDLNSCKHRYRSLKNAGCTLNLSVVFIQFLKNATKQYNKLILQKTKIKGFFQNLCFLATKLIKKREKERKTFLLLPVRAYKHKDMQIISQKLYEH